MKTLRLRVSGQAFRKVALAQLVVAPRAGQAKNLGGKSPLKAVLCRSVR